MAGKNQVIVKDNHEHETKVHKRDLKVIDSDTKVAEMYKELRKEGKRDAQHCIPKKEKPEPMKVDQNSKYNTGRRTGPTLRSSKCKQELNEVKDQIETIPIKDKEHICTDFFSVAGTVIAAGVYTVAVQFINMYLF